MPLSDSGIARRTNGQDISHPRGPIIAKRSVFATAALTATERAHRHHSTGSKCRCLGSAVVPRDTRALGAAIQLPNSRRSVPYNVNASALFHFAQLTHGRSTTRAAIDGGQPPEPAQSEPISYLSKKKRHTEENNHPQCRAAEGIFAPTWHVNLPLRLVPHRRAFKGKPRHRVAGFQTGKQGLGGLGHSPSAP